MKMMGVMGRMGSMLPWVVAAGGMLLFAWLASGQPVPTVTPATALERTAQAVVDTVGNHNPEAVRLSNLYLAGKVEPRYYGTAISNIYTSNQVTAIVKTAAAAAVPPATNPTVIALAFTNRLAAWRVNIGASNWNVIDAATNDVYPPFSLWTTGDLRKPFTNLMSWPLGTPGFSNNFSCTNAHTWFEVRVGQ